MSPTQTTAPVPGGGDVCTHVREGLGDQKTGEPLFISSETHAAAQRMASDEIVLTGVSTHWDNRCTPGTRYVTEFSEPNPQLWIADRFTNTESSEPRKEGRKEGRKYFI